MAATTNLRVRLSRRDLLRTSGAIVVAFGIPPFLGSAGAAAPSAAAGSGGIDSWLAIARDGSVTVFTDKVELGMGVSTAFAQIVAEELDVPVRSVSVVMGDTALTPDQRGVGGSTSISAGAVPVRQAAAEARRLLLALASARLRAPVEHLTVRDGVVTPSDDPARHVSYGDLIGGRRFDVSLRTVGTAAASDVAAATPKPPAEYKVVGTPVPRMDIPPKADGRFAYVVDVRVPGMLHGRVVRPPVPGAKLVRVGPVPAGAISVVAKDDFVGVVAESEWQAIQAARTLAVTWSTSEARWPAMGDLYAAMWAMTPTTRRVAEETGDVEQTLAGSARRVEAKYEWPFQSHAMMGPACAVADVRPGGTTIWSSTQHPHQLQTGIAELLGRPPERVHVVWMEGAGSYGRAGGDDAAGDAAILSQATGRPVRVQWSRADETGWDPKGPAVVMSARAGLDAQGGITAWDYTARGFSGSGTPASPSTAGDLLAGQLMGRPAGGVDVPPPLQESYVFPAKRRTGEVIPWPQEGSPLRTSNLRAPSQPATTFGSESFMDELAAAAGADPVEFRLRYLRDPRHIAVIRAAAKEAAWATRPSPRREAPRDGIASGRGIAYTPRNNTVLATVAVVDVDQSTGEVRVRRLVIAHDCGLIINPDGLRGTIEANLIQSTSRALKEEVRFDRSGVTSVDWHSYPVLMAPEAPDAIDIVLINHPDLPPYGAGEPASVATAPAIANAIFDATGARVRTVPFTPERVKAALARRTP
jgi:nicotinate dehydrogenase subunit B